MMLVGMIWAAFAPLLLVPVILGIAALLRRRGWGRALPLAAALVLAPVALVYAWDRAQFAALCREIGQPVVSGRAVTDGIYLNSGTANSFGSRYLHDEGFSWLERRDIYERSGFVRVTRNADGTHGETKIPAITARYEVQETFEKRPDGNGISWIRVIDRETGGELARAGDAHFDGGRMAWVLGAYGVASCQSAYSKPDSFRAYYHLARNTLRP